jgi:hypothetical protein
MAHASYVRDVSGKGDQISPDEFSAPVLSQALFNAPVGQLDIFRTTLEKAVSDPKTPRAKVTLGGGDISFDDDLAALLGHVQERLEKGLGEAWMSREGYGGGIDLEKARAYLADPAKVDPTQDPIAQLHDLVRFLAEPEEQWARAFAERFIFSKYADPSLIYHNHGGLPDLYGRFPDVYPIAGACQQIATFCVRSRGFRVEDVTAQGVVGLGCSAGSIEAPAFDSAKSQKSPPLKNPPPDGTDKQTQAPAFADTAALAALSITPGSIVTFNPGGPSYKKQDFGPITHIGAVLRRYGRQIQFIDTGVLVGGDTTKSAARQSYGAEGGTTDHEFRIGQLAGATSCVGVGVARSPPPMDLVTCAAKLSAARPLGFVRLAVVDITDKSKPKVRFISKLLHMLYPVSRLVWSLRGLPVEGLSVFWLVHLPQGSEWSKALIEANVAADKPAALLVPKPDHILNPANVLRGDADGTVTVFRHKEESGMGKTGWVKDFDGSIKAEGFVEMGLGFKVAGVGLGRWCARTDTFGKRFVNPPPADKGVVDDSPTTASPALATNFFEP